VPGQNWPMWSEPGPVVTARWLARFRWAVVAGATTTLMIASNWLDVSFPATGATVLVGAHALSNLWLQVVVGRGTEPSDRVLGGLILFDIAVLTALLMITGGPSNPFTVSYLVYITLAAVTLNARWAWGAAVTSMGGYGLLFVTPLRTLANPHAAHGGMDPALSHQIGMGVAFVAGAVLTAAFVTRIRLALESRERALAEARRAAAQQERLASLTTLAAGAAHELATPLSAIAVASRELELAAASAGVPAEISEDARLIRSQVDRCREILDQMSGRADESVVHSARTLPPNRVVEAALATFPAPDRERVVLAMDDRLPNVRVPLEAATRALRTLVKNAFEASADHAPVHLRLEADSGQVRFRIRDHGVGMAADTLQRAGEPFFTTKPVGAGFGLGLFLARTFAERWGGTLTLSSSPADGTTATLLLPAAPEGLQA
ncbi:MAG TPA: ATP-binding protein, partial [Vicinamibacterales bacterium]|nr:ATP-binding protein [Vicinamibacterales bacterium]